MAKEEVTTRLQKKVTLLQQEITKMQRKLSLLDTKSEAKMDAILQAFKEEFMGDIHNLFEQYLGNIAVTSNVST